MLEAVRRLNNNKLCAGRLFVDVNSALYVWSNTRYVLGDNFEDVQVMPVGRTLWNIKPSLFESVTNWILKFDPKKAKYFGDKSAHSNIPPGDWWGRVVGVFNAKGFV